MNNTPIAIVVSRFNQAITKRLVAGALERFKELQPSLAAPPVWWVPGAVELPLIAQQLAKTQQYSAIVCLGAVIRGETTHYDYVCQQASYGCQRVALDHSLPVVFGLLTTENEEQALARVGGAYGHKGRDAIDTAFEMINLLSLNNEQSKW